MAKETSIRKIDQRYAKRTVPLTDTAAYSTTVGGTHTSDATIHFTEASIDHTAILNIGTAPHGTIDAHIANAAIHFIEGAIDHANILNIGTVTHAAIDTHIAGTAQHGTLLHQHVDVDPTGVGEGSVLAWATATTNWVVAEAGSGGGGGGGSAIVTQTAKRHDLLNSDKGTVVDTPDDNFDGTALAGKWTAVGGSAAVIDFLEAGDVAKYELDTDKDLLYMQAGDLTANVVELRQDWTLGDGESIVVAVAFAMEYEDDTASNNELRVGISLNNNDAGYADGTYVWLGFDVDAGKAVNIVSYDGGTVYDGQVLNGNIGLAFLRFLRSGSNYYAMYSRDGLTWTRLGTYTGTTYDNLWIFADCGSTGLNPPIPVTVFHWVRQGTDDLNPWDPMVEEVTGITGSSFPVGTATPNEGDLLVYNGGTWQPSSLWGTPFPDTSGSAIQLWKLIPDVGTAHVVVGTVTYGYWFDVVGNAGAGASFGTSGFHKNDHDGTSYNEVDIYDSGGGTITFRLQDNIGGSPADELTIYTNMTVVAWDLAVRLLILT